MSLLLLMFAGIGVLCIGLAVPLIKGWVKPNHWYGFRIRLTLEDPRIWYPANRYAGWLLLVYGLAIVLASFGLYFLVRGLEDEAAKDAYGLAFAGLLMAGVGLLLILSVRYAHRLAKRQSGDDSPRGT